MKRRADDVVSVPSKQTLSGRVDGDDALSCVDDDEGVAGRFNQKRSERRLHPL